MSAAAAWEQATPADLPGRPRLRLVPTGDAVPAPARRRLRVTRRGRLALTVTALVLIAVAAYSAWASRAEASTAGAPEHVVTVTHGQSLSQVARREMPGVPVDQAVARLAQTNHLPTDQVMSGQRLVVPVG